MGIGGPRVGLFAGYPPEVLALSDERKPDDAWQGQRRPHAHPEAVESPCQASGEIDLSPRPPFLGKGVMFHPPGWATRHHNGGRPGTGDGLWRASRPARGRGGKPAQSCAGTSWKDSENVRARVLDRAVVLVRRILYLAVSYEQRNQVNCPPNRNPGSGFWRIE